MINETYKILDVDDWVTPATSYPIKSLDESRIIRTRRSEGFYRMEGVNGYDLYQVVKPIKITSLKIGKEEVMNDEPINWLGMKSLANLSGGRVLVGGLGLGLILHALAKNPLVQTVTVVEINKSVINLVSPFLMEARVFTDLELEIIQDDVVKFMMEHHNSFETIILDIWWGRGKALAQQMGIISALTKSIQSKAQIFVWGSKDPQWNPSVEKLSVI